jgi:hypothetical protein
LGVALAAAFLAAMQETTGTQEEQH